MEELSKLGPGADGRVLQEVLGGAERLAGWGRGGGRPGLESEAGVGRNGELRTRWRDEA